VNANLADLAYLIAAVLFMFGLKDMAHPKRAVRGNLRGASGMLLAIVTALGDPHVKQYGLPVVGLLLGGAVGATLALRTPMTAMPQMVALLNGFGGLASLLVAIADMVHDRQLVRSHEASLDVLLAIAASTIVGAVTFWGSLLAYGKLEEYDWLKKPWRYPAQQPLNAVLAAATLALAAAMVYLAAGGHFGWSLVFLVLVALLASVLGVTLVNPIGGADMPVVISLLNSYSGIAAGLTGFVIANNVLIISGALVGASGIILTRIMCRAMNRSLVHVLFGVMDASQGPKAEDVYARVRSATPEDVALLLDGARRVVIVPGYGMAVAQAQHAVHELETVLEARGTSVEYAIHPVAGRMPGHMNVLLAEADVPYERLKEMDQINPTLDTVDVALVLGANDVVNPLAKTDPHSPIAGMPIIEVHRCRSVVVIKRSLSPGFAGIPNPLFAADNTVMLFADGKEAVLDILKALKENA
jgi:NAD(P) transhydrogenase subunit beta